jgi:hypothetical protein
MTEDITVDFLNALRECIMRQTIRKECDNFVIVDEASSIRRRMRTLKLCKVRTPTECVRWNAGD